MHKQYDTITLTRETTYSLTELILEETSNKRKAIDAIMTQLSGASLPKALPSPSIIEDYPYYYLTGPEIYDDYHLEAGAAQVVHAHGDDAFGRFYRNMPDVKLMTSTEPYGKSVCAICEEAGCTYPLRKVIR